MDSTLVESNPGETTSSRLKLRSRRPAPIRSVTESAISEMINNPRKRRLATLPLLRMPSRKESCMVFFDRRYPGARPAALPVSSATSTVNNKTRQSRFTCSRRGRSPPPILAKTLGVQ